MRINPWLACAVLPILVSCKDDSPEDKPGGNDYSDGVFVSNEGPFQGGNGTLSFFDPESGTVSNNVFLNENERPLGNVVHSLHVFDGKLYVVINNGGAVEVADAADLDSEGTITGLQSPRYVRGISGNMIAISTWGDNSVGFYNPSTGNLISSVSVGNGPERMLLNGNHLYIANSGGFVLDSTVTVVDVTTRTAVDTIFVGYNPNGFALDSNGDLWVLCGGYTDWNNSDNNREASLVKVDPANRSVISSFDFPDGDRPTGLAINQAGQKLFYLNNGYGGKPFSMDIGAAELPQTSLLPNAELYSLGYDSDRNDLYFGDAVDYASNGKVYRFDYVNGVVTDTLSVGIIPGNFEFN